MIEDAELLQRYCSDHSEESFAELVRRHMDLVYGAALRRLAGNSHFAEDAAQAVFCDLARKAPALRHHPAIVAWLHTSTRYACLAITRRETRRQRRDQEAYAMQEITLPSPQGWEELRPLIDAALDELGEDDRHALLLRFFDSQSLASVGAQLHVSEEAARKRIDRALDKLHSKLSRRHITSSAAALALALANAPGIAAPAGLAAASTQAAIATAAAGAGITGALSTLLTMTQLKAGTIALLSIAGVATVGSFVAGTYAREQRNQLAALQQQLSNETADRHALDRMRTQGLSAEEKLGTVSVQAEQAAKVREKKERLLRLIHNAYLRNAAQRKSPLSAALNKLWVETAMQTTIEGAFGDLGLDPLKKKKLRALLVQQCEENQKGDSEKNRALQEEILGLLGDANYKAIIASSTRYFGNEKAKSFETDIADACLPLSPEQSQKLRDILGFSSDAISNPEARDSFHDNPPESPVMSKAELHAIDKAAAILSPEQHKHLAAFMENERKETALRMQLEAEFRKELQP
ncbi:MAG: sigma-70 family RNA polymerase sigma factor [Opitutaceae bacterium]|jgi:RNA polymerase sigma factor (sigma-70 family)